MKLITAIVRPESLDELSRAVVQAGARGLTATEAKGFGQQFGRSRAGWPPGGEVQLLPKVRVEILVRDDETYAIMEALTKAIYTGGIGDGKVWVCPVEAAVRVRTGEHDRAAV